MNEMDARVAELLKKRQNGMLSDADKVELESLISQREDIIIKYRLEEETGSGFEQIAMGVESAIARAKARNPFAETDISIYEDALKAGAEGMAAYNQQLNERYDAEYALIAAMETAWPKRMRLRNLMRATMPTVSLRRRNTRPFCKRQRRNFLAVRRCSRQRRRSRTCANC